MRRGAAPFTFALFMLLLHTSSASAQVEWVGDLETGDTSQFDYLLNPVINDVRYINVVQDVVTQGNHAVKIELHDDAKWSNGLRRVEMQHSPQAMRTAEGATLYFAWSFYLPTTLPTSPSQQIGYWESKSSYKQMMSFTLKGEELSFTTRQPQNKVQWTGQGVVTPGVWHRVALRVTWSKDETIGEVDVWFDGQQVVTGAKAKTLADDNPHFTQLGLLRGDADFTDVPVIYIDDVVQGVTLADVRPDAVSMMPEPEMEPEPDMGSMMEEEDMAPDMMAQEEMGSAPPEDMAQPLEDMEIPVTTDMADMAPMIADMPDLATSEGPEPTPGRTLPPRVDPPEDDGGCAQSGARPASLPVTILLSLLGIVGLARKRRRLRR